MKSKAIFVLLGAILFAPALTYAQDIEGYLHEDVPGIRYKWKSFPATLTADVSATNKEWVMVQEQAAMGNSMRVFTPKSESKSKNPTEIIVIESITFRLVPSKTPLTAYADLWKETGEILCGDKKNGYKVEIFKQTEGDIILQLQLNGCQNGGKTYNTTELRRTLRSNYGFFTIIYSVDSPNISKETLKQMRTVIDSTKGITLYEKNGGSGL